MIAYRDVKIAAAVMPRSVSPEALSSVERRDF